LELETGIELMSSKLTGLVAATHTPFRADGELNLAIVEKQAEHLLRIGVSSVFIGGTTGECHSLTVEERLALAQRWSEIARGSKMRVVVHVGSNCLADSRSLATQAQSLGVFAIAAFAPSYFKPKSLDTLIACCETIASAAPELPFYYYDIPSMTGLQHSMPDFLARAPERIPTLTGIKFTNNDMMSYQKCLSVNGGWFDLPWGFDEYLLPALAAGAVGAVGSTYNFAAPIYQRIMAAFAKGNFAAARAEQLRSIQLIELLAEFGFMGAAKALMGFLGVDAGPPRLPNASLTTSERDTLRGRLESAGCLEWIRA
jgi:N-acetylneuraminate lyase